MDNRPPLHLLLLAYLQSETAEAIVSMLTQRSNRWARAADHGYTDFLGLT